MPFPKFQPFYGTVNSSAAIPTVCGLFCIIHFDQYLILTCMYKICNLKPEWTVSILASPRSMPIYPYGTVLINSSELQIIARIVLFGIQHDFFAVPTNTPTVTKSLCLPLLHIFPNRSSNCPVMGKVNRCKTFLSVSLQRKFPPLHKLDFFSRHI